MISLVMVAAALHQINAPSHPLRPPNGTYVYSMTVSGRVDFKSTIVIEGNGSTFVISETTKLPNGLATARTTWSTAALLPISFEVHQGTIALHAQITPLAANFSHPHVSIRRIQGTSYMLPSVGLISSDMMLGYLAIAHPGEPFTMLEIQNSGQTVRIQPRSTSPLWKGPAGDLSIAVTKQERHGNNKDLEQIVEWLNRKTGIMDEGGAFPGDATITLLRFTPSGR